MKYCTHCGAQVNDEAYICTACGCRVEGRASARQSEGNDILGIIAKILMVLSCIAAGMAGLMFLALIPIFAFTGPVLSEIFIFILGVSGITALCALAWCIPMTVHVFRKLKNNEPIGTGMKVCILIFVNAICGILLLCMNDQNQ